eukprot:6311255-Prymnesium_polylepis.1
MNKAVARKGVAFKFRGTLLTRERLSLGVRALGYSKTLEPGTLRDPTATGQTGRCRFAARTP